MAINKVSFNSTDLWEEFGATLKSAPKYPIPAEVKELVKIKGANGTLTEATGYFNDLELKLEFRCLLPFSTVKDFWALKHRINKMFNYITDNRLHFSEYEKKYYKVKSAEVGVVTKISDTEVDFDVNFICDPFLYSTDDVPVKQQGAIMYSGDIPNKPVIRITAQAGGTATITCNGRTLKFTTQSAGVIKINESPYSAVTLDGAGIPSTGETPTFRSGTNNISISTSFSLGSDGLTIIKNERYLG